MSTNIYNKLIEITSLENKNLKRKNGELVNEINKLKETNDKLLNREVFLLKRIGHLKELVKKANEYKYELSNDIISLQTIIKSCNKELEKINSNIIINIIRSAIIYLSFSSESKKKRRFKKEKIEIIKSGLFDEEFYRSSYLVSSGYKYINIHPVDHYILVGADLGYNPNPTFDTLMYLQLNPELCSENNVRNALYDFIIKNNINNNKSK